MQWNSRPVSRCRLLLVSLTHHFHLILTFFFTLDLNREGESFTVFALRTLRYDCDRPSSKVLLHSATVTHSISASGDRDDSKCLCTNSKAHESLRRSTSSPRKGDEAGRERTGSQEASQRHKGVLLHSLPRASPLQVIKWI